MMNVNCEDFEREFAGFFSGEIDADRKDALEEHRRNCSSCQRFNEETGAIREALHRIPKLEVPPYFTANVKREVNRLELGLKKPDWNPRLLPRFLSVSTGFAMALICGLLFFQPNRQQAVYPTLTGSNPSEAGQISDSEKPADLPEQIERPLISDPSEDLFAGEVSTFDTLTHRLPEPPGQDSISIPFEDDFWQLNQVSTTPDEH